MLLTYFSALGRVVMKKIINMRHRSQCPILITLPQMRDFGEEVKNKAVIQIFSANNHEEFHIRLWY